MFYHIRPNGFPVRFESFEVYLTELQRHAETVNTTTASRVRVPQRSDYHFNDYPAEYGFDGRPIRIWTKDGNLIGYEF